MKHVTVDSQRDLDHLRDAVCWDDSDLVDLCGTRTPQSCFPTDIQYPGRSTLDYHCLYGVCCAPTSHLELVFIGCDYVRSGFLERMYVNGRISASLNVRLLDYTGETELECARLIYRFVDLTVEHSRGYFLRPGVLDYPLGTFVEDGYGALQASDKHLLTMLIDSAVELTVADHEGHATSIKLQGHNLIQLADVLRQAIQKIEQDARANG